MSPFKLGWGKSRIWLQDTTIFINGGNRVFRTLVSVSIKNRKWEIKNILDLPSSVNWGNT